MLLPITWFTLLIAGLAGFAPAPAPEVWLCHLHPEQLVAQDARLDPAHLPFDGLKLYIGNTQQLPEATFARLADLQRRAHLKVAVEVGGTLGFGPLDDTNGQACAGYELKKLRRFTDAGGHIDYLDIDGPVRRLLHPRNRRGFKSIPRCVRQLMEYMKVVRKAYPDITFCVLSNFPNWQWKGRAAYQADWGDYYQVISEITRQATAEGMPVRGLTVDNPYDYALGLVPSKYWPEPQKEDWVGRIQELQAYALDRGLEFNLIINSQRGGKQSAEAFCKDTLAYFELVRRQFKHQPRRFIVQSWYPYPERVLPPDEPYTMTWLTGEIKRRLEEGE